MFLRTRRGIVAGHGIDIAPTVDSFTRRTASFFPAARPHRTPRSLPARVGVDHAHAGLHLGICGTDDQNAPLEGVAWKVRRPFASSSMMAWVRSLTKGATASSQRVLQRPCSSNIKFFSPSSIAASAHQLGDRVGRSSASSRSVRLNPMGHTVESLIDGAPADRDTTR